MQLQPKAPAVLLNARVCYPQCYPGLQRIHLNFFSKWHRNLRNVSSVKARLGGLYDRNLLLPFQWLSRPESWCQMVDISGAILFTCLVAKTQEKQTNGRKVYFAPQFESTVHRGEERGAAGGQLVTLGPHQNAQSGECTAQLTFSLFPLYSLQDFGPWSGTHIQSESLCSFIPLMDKPGCLCCNCLGTVKINRPRRLSLSVSQFPLLTKTLVKLYGDSP